MARRTKQEAQATRDSILDAAEMLFEQQGVSRTTLQHIAAAAGVSRGAIYWHFEDKSALFNAMMERAVMPLESAMQCRDETEIIDPLADIRAWLVTAFRLASTDAKARRAFDIATHKVEYVDELIAVRDRHLENHRQWLSRAESRLKLAARRGMLRADVTPRTAARGLWAMADGLLRIWLLEPASFNLLKVGTQLLDTHLDAMRIDAARESGKRHTGGA